MKIEVSKTSITFIREPDDPKFYGVKEAKGESNLFHWLKKQIANGHPDLPDGFPTDFIKKRMWKDGHMVDEMQQYLRSRKPVETDEDGDKLYLAMSNGYWAIQGAEYYWNDGSVTLNLDRVTICNTELNRRNPLRTAEQSKKNWDNMGKELGI